MITTAIVFNHRGRIGKDGTGPIEIRVKTNDNKVYYINTGIKVLKRNFVGGTVVGQIDCNELNERLAIIYKKVQDEINEYLKNGRPVDVGDVRRKVWSVVDDGSGTSVIDFYTEQMELMQLREGTMKHYRTVRNRLEEFALIKHWSDVTAENLCKWDSWLHNIKKRQSDIDKKLGKDEEYLSDAAIYNHHKCFKCIINRAVLFGKTHYNPYERLRGKFKRGNSQKAEYLNEAEITAVEGIHPIEGTTMAVTRDLFVFQMHTGLSFADVQAFDFSQYRQQDGVWMCTAKRVKTGVTYNTRLTDECLAILKKYGWKLPKIDNADYNHCLKALGAAVGIEKPLHSHLARHTFATRMLRMGVRVENLSKMLGHTNITQTQRYAKIMAQSVHEDFEMVDKKLKENKDKTKKGA